MRCRIRVRRSSGCGVALGCGVAQIVVRRRLLHGRPRFDSLLGTSTMEIPLLRGSSEYISVCLDYCNLYVVKLSQEVNFNKS